MNQPAPRTIFFTGTDTDVGKTYTAALITRSLRHFGVNVGVYKPVASGCSAEGENLVADDAAELWEAAGRTSELDDVCPQRFVAPLAPPQAARLEGKVVDRKRLRAGAAACAAGRDVLVVEGAGGLMSPLADGVLNIDLAKQFANVQLIIVVANRLGAIHQTLATCAAAASHGITPAGIILCSPTADRDDSVDTNAAEIRRYTDVAVLGEVAFGAEQVEDAILQFFSRTSC